LKLIRKRKERCMQWQGAAFCILPYDYSAAPMPASQISGWCEKVG
jgi:hypothetical protein